MLDSETQLAGVPKAAWDYRLGNRSALDWILDQYKAKTPKDPTIREKFNTYRFADYKEQVADLIARLEALGHRVQVADPLADDAEAKHEYGLDLVALDHHGSRTDLP